MKAFVRGPNEPIQVAFFEHDSHRVEPIETVINQYLVGYLCVDCDEALPFNWACPDCMFVEVTRLDDDSPQWAVGRMCRWHLNDDRRLWQ